MSFSICCKIVPVLNLGGVSKRISDTCLSAPT